VITVQPPPTPNPHPWWLLHEAITYAVILQEKHDKVPWIKTGEQILTPKQITELYLTMGDVSTFGRKLVSPSKTHLVTGAVYSLGSISRLLSSPKGRFPWQNTFSC
jgi:hypothetical protein